MGDDKSRKQAAERARSPIRSRFSRKAVKSVASDDAPSVDTKNGDGKQPAVVEEKRTSTGPPPVRPRLTSTNSTISIIPDPLNELPDWFRQEVEPVMASAAECRSKYPMHNPIGPRFYYNFHLLPANESAPAQFSAQFPPISSPIDRSQESTRNGPALSRTPSGSPLPTPDSSQLKVNESGNNRLRTRKISQTAHDEVDMLDVSDPWGTNWHHHSPYDIGLDTQISTDEQPPVRSRRLSLDTAHAHRSVIPSPLSQSTSAVHLHQYGNVPPRQSRRLSSSGRPFGSLFGNKGESDSGHERAATAPAEVFPSRPFNRRSVSGPPLSPSANANAPVATDLLTPDSAKKSKRTSFLGRLTKRFSSQKKHGEPAAAESTSPVSPTGPEMMAVPAIRQPVPKGHQPAPIQMPQPEPLLMRTSKEIRRLSHAPSVEEHYSLGNITIANPDEPRPEPAPERAHSPAQPMLDGPLSSSPVATEAPLPADESPQPSQHSLHERAPTPPEPKAPSPAPSHHSALSPTPAAKDAPLPPTPEPGSPGTDWRGPSTYATNGASLAGLTYASASDVSSEDPALARASVLANPPTPYASPRILPAKLARVRRSEDGARPAMEAPPPVPKEKDREPKGKDRAKEEPRREAAGLHAKSSSQTRRRETETFRLVRSPSGRVYGPGDVIPGMGDDERWEVVAGPEHKKSRRDKDRGSGKDKEREEHDRKASKDSGRERGSSAEDERRAKSAARKPVPNFEPPAVAVSAPQPQPQVARVASTGANVARRPSKSSSKEGPPVVANSPRKDRSTSRQRRESSEAHSLKPPSSSGHQKHPSQSSAQTGASVRRVSASTTGARPTSDVPVADQHLRAKDAWDVDRLYRGRSLYGPDGAPILSIPSQLGGDSRPSTLVSADMHRAGTIPSTTDLHAPHARAQSLPGPGFAGPVGAHGSGHTYVVPPAAHQVYGSMHAPAPVAAPPPVQSPPRTRPRRSNTGGERVPFPALNSSNDPRNLTRNFLANPLPDPPRVSQYQAAPLPPSLRAESTAAPSFWTGVAASARN